jgi:hypothetical protein
MNRRDFLLLRRESRGRVAELSCERLYMRFLDLRLQGADAADCAAEGDAERAPVFAARSTRELFAGLEQDLAGVDVLRLIDRAWLERADFREALEPVLRAVAAHGEIQ